MSIKLHLGCGSKIKEGWVNIDAVPELKPDIVHDISRPLPFADLSAGEVLAEDLLEHFDKYMRYIVFYQWTKVLMIDGIITIRVPNFKKLLWRYFKFGYDKFVDQVFGETMWNSEVYTSHFGGHKWGYSQQTLEDFVKQFHIIPTRITLDGLNIELVGRKEKHLSEDDFSKLKVVSLVNNREYPMSFVQERIRNFQLAEEQLSANLKKQPL